MGETGKGKTAEEKAEAQALKESLAEAAAVAAENDEQTYTADEHISLAYSMYEEPSHVIAGAMEMIPGNKKNFTKSEITEAIAAFKKHKVQ